MTRNLYQFWLDLPAEAGDAFVRLERDGPLIVAYLEEPPLHGDGMTIRDALEDLKRALDRLCNTYDTDALMRQITTVHPK